MRKVYEITTRRAHLTWHTHRIYADSEDEAVRKFHAGNIYASFQDLHEADHEEVTAVEWAETEWDEEDEVDD